MVSLAPTAEAMVAQAATQAIRKCRLPTAMLQRAMQQLNKVSGALAECGTTRHSLSARDPSENGSTCPFGLPTASFSWRRLSLLQQLPSITAATIDQQGKALMLMLRLTSVQN
jgi:hypothetical protein